jgi:hypothetical protein
VVIYRSDGKLIETQINLKNKMKTKIFILLALLSGLFSYNVYSQDGLGQGSGISNIYDVNTVETLSGEVTGIDKIYTSNNMYGLHMTIYSGNGQMLVHLGPVWFVENQDIEIAEGDYVIVTGSRITFNDTQVIIAKEVMKDEKVLLLRDDNGYPLWAAWPNR